MNNLTTASFWVFSFECAHKQMSHITNTKRSRWFISHTFTYSAERRQTLRLKSQQILHMASLDQSLVPVSFPFKLNRTSIHVYVTYIIRDATKLYKWKHKNRKKKAFCVIYFVFTLSTITWLYISTLLSGKMTTPNQKLCYGQHAGLSVTNPVTVVTLRLNYVIRAPANKTQLCKSPFWLKTVPTISLLLPHRHNKIYNYF